MKYFLITLITAILYLAYPIMGHGQTNDKILKSEGEIPKEFITSSSSKYKKELATFKKTKSNKKGSRRSKKNKKRFLLESRFAIDDILQSGLVLFNDPVTSYVNEVLKTLPIEDRKLKKKDPRVYVLNSAAVNAFATDQGIIFVTLGLLANLENEAQLAFILSHELIHIKNNHAVNTFTRSKDIDRKNKNLNKMGVDEENEKFSSHPSSVKRLEKLKNNVTITENSKKKSFIVGEQRFLDIQKIARYQLPFLSLDAENFPEAIYLSYLQLQENPTNIELKKVIGKALYMSSKFKNYYYGDDRGTLEMDYWENLEGASQRIYHFLNKMPADELILLATKYNWSIRSEVKENSSFQFLMDDLFIELNDHYTKLDIFSTTDRPAPQKNEEEEEIAVEMIDNTVDSTKTQKLELIPTTINYSKKEKIENANKEDNSYWKYAFVEELKNPEFKEGFKNGKIAYDRRTKLEKTPVKKKKSKSLGIEKVVVVNPFYLSIDARKKDAIQLIRTEEKQQYFRSAIDRLSKNAKISATLLDVSNLSTKEVDKFNDIAQVNQYLGQQLSHNEMTLTPGYRQEEIDAIAEKYDTKYFLWTGVISLREKNTGAWIWAGGSILLPYLLPFTLPNALTPKYDMLYYAILFDVKTGRRSVIKMEYFDKKDSKTILNAHIYDVFHQIKSER